MNKHIRAYIHKYEPKWWTEAPEDEKQRRNPNFKNGDAAIVINDLGLNLKMYEAIPICLPSPTIFTKEFQVSLRGRGRMYEECQPVTKPSTTATSTQSSSPSMYSTTATSKSIPKPFTSCITNGERIHNDLPDNSKFKFLTCKNYVRQKNHGNDIGNCFGIENAKIKIDGKTNSGYKKGLISTDLTITFSGQAGDQNREMEIQIPKADMCEDLSDEVMKLLYKGGGLELTREDLKEPSRIVVFEKDDKNTNMDSYFLAWEKLQYQNHYAYCYNIKRVLKFGVCEVTRTFHQPQLHQSNQKVKIDFGFCGSSCGTPNMNDLYFSQYAEYQTWNRQLWEIKAIYHEDYQSDAEFSEYLFMFSCSSCTPFLMYS